MSLLSEFESAVRLHEMAGSQENPDELREQYRIKKREMQHFMRLAEIALVRMGHNMNLFDLHTDESDQLASKFSKELSKCWIDMISKLRKKVLLSKRSGKTTTAKGHKANAS